MENSAALFSSNNPHRNINIVESAATAGAILTSAALGALAFLFRNKSSFKALVGVSGGMGVLAVAIPSTAEIAKKTLIKRPGQEGALFIPPTTQQLQDELTHFGIATALNAPSSYDNAMDSLFDVAEGEQLGKDPGLPGTKEQWADAAFVSQYDKYFRLAALLSDLVLAKVAVQYGAEENPKNDIGEHIAHQRNQDYKIYFSVLRTYHEARGLSTKSEDGNILYERNATQVPEIDLFYQDGTVQNRWRERYNTFCERVKPLEPHFKLAGLRQEVDQRYARWAVPDTEQSRHLFRARPDTIPT